MCLELFDYNQDSKILVIFLVDTLLRSLFMLRYYYTNWKGADGIVGYSRLTIDKFLILLPTLIAVN